MLNCVSCGKEFEDVDGYAGPTCGNPRCIRKAREQGKLFAAPAVIGKVKRGRGGLQPHNQAADLGLPED